MNIRIEHIIILVLAIIIVLYFVGGLRDFRIDPLSVLVLTIAAMVILYAIRRLLEPDIYVRVRDEEEHKKKYKEHSDAFNKHKKDKEAAAKKKEEDDRHKREEELTKREEELTKREEELKKKEAAKKEASKREAAKKEAAKKEAAKKEAAKKEAAKKEAAKSSNHKKTTNPSNGTTNDTSTEAFDGYSLYNRDMNQPDGFELLSNGVDKVMKGFNVTMRPPKNMREGFEMRSDDLVGDVKAAFAGGLVKPKPEVGRGSAELGGVVGRIVIPASCPNVLIKQGERFYLHNTRKAEVPGVNPIVFENLEDYTEFIRWQRMNGIRCPVLSLQETSDGEFIANGNIPNCEDIVGLPQWSLLEDAGRTKGNIPAFDGRNQDVGLITPLDMIRRRGGNGDI
jgi:hypothetical protein